MPLRPPQQARSRRTLNRLTEAAMELMAEKGVEQTSVAEIVERARSSVGSFYARFDGKEDFVAYLERRVWDDARERWDAAVARLEGRSLPPAQLVAGVVRLLVETNGQDRGRRRALGAATGSMARASAFHEHVLQGVKGLLLRDDRSGFRHPHPDRAVTLGYRVIAAALQELPTLTGGIGGEEERLVSELTRLYLAYLGSDEAPPAPRDRGETTRPVEGRESSADEGAPRATEDEPREPDAQPRPAREPERVDFFDVWG